MNVYVGITDGEWFDFLRERNLAEVNFWKPSGASFKALKEPAPRAAVPGLAPRQRVPRVGI